ncbi:MAG: metallophosphoesterase [Candidatus Woesearchaeota archaeon]
MEISKGIEIVDLGLRIGNILIIADLHIGFEEALNKQGILVPRFQFNDLRSRLRNMIRKARPQTIVVNGDIKHEFGRVSEQEWRETLKILDLLLESSKEVVLVKGNHDTILGPIAGKRGVRITDSYEIEDRGILVMHGHETTGIPKHIRTIITAHEHPAVSIRDGPRVEVFKCFLKGSWKGKELIVMPSLNLATEGSDITKEDILSPFLDQRMDDFEVFVVGDTTYDFGRLGDIDNRLG